MIMAMVKGEIMDVFPYIGASKVSCPMCSHYIGAFNQVCKQISLLKALMGRLTLGGPGLVFLVVTKNFVRPF